MLTLKIVSPEKVIFNGPVESVKVPGVMGEFEILNNHAPIISALQAGRVEYKTKDSQEQFEVVGGFVEVQRNVVSLCIEMQA